MVRVLTDSRVLASTALIGGLLAVALWPATVLVDLAPVVRGPLAVTVEAEGRTRVRDRFLITAPVTGRILRIELEPGDRVVRGHAIAQLQPAMPALLDPRARAEAVAALGSAEASLGRARADAQRAQAVLAQVRRNLSRARNLHAAGAAAPEVLEAHETEVSRAADGATAAAFAVRAATAGVERAKARLGTFARRGNDEPVTVRSPIDGVMLRRFRESESMVPAGEPLVEIGDPWQLEIVADLLSTDAVRVTAGARATVEHWGGDTVLAATVRRIEPAAFAKISALGLDEQRVNVILDFTDAGEDGAAVGDAYRVDVRIVVWAASDVLKVPTSALVRDGRHWAVYVARNGQARRTIVDVGRHSAREAEVRSGLSERATVVIHPSDLVRDGVRIANRAEP